MAKTFEECLIDARKVEAVINRNLFVACAIITLVAMAMVVIEFFSRGNFFPSRIGFFYIGVLFVYSAHKEMLRWLGEKGTKRAGEFFLYSWIGLTLFSTLSTSGPRIITALPWKASPWVVYPM